MITPELNVALVNWLWWSVLLMKGAIFVYIVYVVIAVIALLKD